MMLYLPTHFLTNTIFKNEDLYNYFMGCIWYSPTCDSTDFDDNIFNEYEKANLEILSDLDTY